MTEPHERIEQKPSTWYRVAFGRIDPVEVTKWTEKTVTVAPDMWTRGGRRAQVAHWESFHPTREAAKAYLVQQRRTELERARRSLDRAGELLRNAEAM